MAMREHINRSIWSLTWPNALSNLTVPLLGIADVAIAGMAGGDSLIGAVAVGTAIFNFIYMNCGFLRMGTTGLTAQSHGAALFCESKRILVRAIFVALSIAFVIVLLKRPIANLAVIAMGGTDDLMSLVNRYVTIRLWAVPAALPVLAFNGWFVGMQDARTPLVVSVIANAVNILSSAIFTLHFNMGIEGIALGTVVAQYVSFALFSWRFFASHCDWSSPLSHYFTNACMSLKGKQMKAFFVINTNVFIRNICITLTYTLFTRFSANISDSVLATNTLLMQFFTLYSYLFDGCAYAAEALSGKFIGSRSGHMFRLSVRWLFIWAIGISSLYVVVYALFWNNLLSLFNPSPDVMSCSARYMWYVIAVPVVGCLPYMADGILFGATTIRPLTVSSAIATASFTISSCSLIPFIDNDGLWISFILFTLLRGLLLIKPICRLYQKPFPD